MATSYVNDAAQSIGVPASLLDSLLGGSSANSPDPYGHAATGASILRGFLNQYGNARDASAAFLFGDVTQATRNQASQFLLSNGLDPTSGFAYAPADTPIPTPKPDVPGTSGPSIGSLMTTKGLLDYFFPSAPSLPSPLTGKFDEAVQWLKEKGLSVIVLLVMVVLVLFGAFRLVTSDK